MQSTGVTARVLVASSTALSIQGEIALTTGVAIDANGTVLTALPYSPTGRSTVAYDVLVSFDLNLSDGTITTPTLPFGIDDLYASETMNMATDSAGDFLIAPGRVGSNGNSAAGFDVVNPGVNAARIG